MVLKTVVVQQPSAAGIKNTNSTLRQCCKATAFGMAGMLSMTAAVVGVAGAGAAGFSAYLWQSGLVQTPVDIEMTKGIIAGGIAVGALGVAGAVFFKRCMGNLTKANPKGDEARD
jgi:hypothetical protein